MQEQARDDLEMPPYLWGQMGLTNGDERVCQCDHKLSIYLWKPTVIRRYSDDWTKFNVVSIFKKAKVKNPQNYRLVSLNSIPGNIIERILLESTSNHIQNKVAISSEPGLTN